jgi:hypothetical protein
MGLSVESSLLLFKKLEQALNKDLSGKSLPN